MQGEGKDSFDALICFSLAEFHLGVIPTLYKIPLIS